jgi:rubrerythrin
MSILFTPNEVFDIAIEIERNGAAFYRGAAAVASDAKVRNELIDLAKMEDGHESIFNEMKQELGSGGGDATFDADGELTMYLRNFASGQVFDVKKEPPEAVLASMEKTLRFALERERDSVVFFLGMKEWMPAGSARVKIEGIIKQEMGHIAMLGRRLMEVAGRG